MPSMDDHYKANGTRLNRLLIDRGTEEMRKVFDSIHLPATLTAVLKPNYAFFKRQKFINSTQMDVLFPPIPLVPSTSKDYDITLLFILLRNICRLNPPTSTGSWDKLPPSIDHSLEANLVRIKYYRNDIYAHITSTGVDDVKFQSYWNDLSAALTGLGVNLDEINVLKVASLDVKSQTKINILTLLLICTICVTVSVMCWFYNYPKEVQATFALNFSSHINTDFVGRKWFFQELEHAVNNSHPQSAGIIILGDPGSGKSAIMSQLFSSPSSSAFIHKNIIGYHVCKFDEARTRNGLRFVHTLVQQLAKNIPEYSSAIEKPEIQNELNIHCKGDPIGCFHTTILDPIKELKGQVNTKFILIDALDECIKKAGKSSKIITILKNKMADFPVWIKLIISSRNKTSLIAKFPTFEKLAINSTDQRNLEDIRSYVEHVTHGNDRFKTEPENKCVKGLIKQLNEINEGNFLYFKILLQCCGVYNQSRDFFPRTLDRLYGSFFRDRFKKEDFKCFAPLFEVLLASNSPPTMTELEAILKIRKDTYKTQKVVNKVSEYLIISSNKTVRFYHQSFADWLMNETKNSDGLFIQKSEGHQYIVDYLFDYFHKTNTTLSLQELKELSMHVLFGEMEKRQVRKLQSLNVTEIRDPRSSECILHELAKETKSTPIIKIFLKNFDSIDMLAGFDRLTPLCYAAWYGNFDNLKLFIDNGADVNNVFNSNHSTIFTIAGEGYTEIAKLLIRNDVDFDKENQFREKPLQVAIWNSQLDFVKLLINEGVEADVSALYHAAARNEPDIVRFLLDSEIRDVCLACEAGVPYSCPTRNFAYPYHSTTDSCFCETALYAAVSWSDLNVAKLLLSYGKASLECKHFSGQTPLLLAAERNDSEMATLLLNKGANAKAVSETLINKYEDNKFYTENCNKDVCSSCGTGSIHLFAKQRSWDTVKELVSRWNVNPFSENCQGLSPISFAIMQDRVDIIRNFNATYAGEITTFIVNKTAVRYTALCGSPETLKWLSSIANSSVFEMVYEDGMTLLHLAANWSAYPVLDFADLLPKWIIKSCTEDISYTEDLLCTNDIDDDDDCSNKTNFFLQSVNEYKKRLMTVRLLSRLQQNINKTDKYGRTALHYAAARGFSGAVIHLVRQGSDWRIKDKNGDTPLKLALKKSPPRPRHFLLCRMTSDDVFQSCNSTMFDETVRYLIMLQKSTLKKCNTDTKRLLRTLVRKEMPLSLYSLFKTGVDVNCGVALKIQLNILKLKNDEIADTISYEIDSEFTNEISCEISEVFKIFEVNMKVECDVPFNRSELHLMAYLARTNNFGNFFKPSVNNRSFPLQRIINSHPKGFRVLDECRDKEGYLAIHRAAQGGNIDAVSWFISLGVDIFKKTRSGLNAVDLSIKYLPPEQILEGLIFHLQYSISFYSNYIAELQNLRKRTFKKLLEQFLETINYKGSTSFSWCKPEFTALSPLHIAAAFGGMERLNYVREESRILPISCTNKHGIEPRYLGNLYQSVDPDIWQSLDLPAYEGRYPEREAEYNLIYNYFFQTPEVDLSFELDFEGLFKCHGMNDLLPKRKEIEGQIQQCNNHCWKSALQVIRNLSSAFLDIVIEHASFDTFGKGFTHTVAQFAMSELRYHTVKMFYKIPAGFWRQLLEAYSCSYRCRCVDIMRLLQVQFTSQPRRNRQVGEFVAERMGWNDTSTDGDVLYRWPFRFLLKKALKKDKDYEYLKIIGDFIFW